jgi:hypothetical protein
MIVLLLRFNQELNESVLNVPPDCGRSRDGALSNSLTDTEFCRLTCARDCETTKVKIDDECDLNWHKRSRTHVHKQFTNTMNNGGNPLPTSHDRTMTGCG